MIQGIKNLLFDGYGLRMWFVMFIMIGGMSLFFGSILWYLFHIEGIFVNSLNCGELGDYLTNNSDAGLTAKWQYEERC